MGLQQSTHTASYVPKVKKEEVTGFLYLLEDMLKKYIDEISKSYALNDIGEKTPLVGMIESVLSKSKIENLYSISKDIDEQILFIIDDIFIKFLKTQKSIIKSVYRVKTQNKLDLYYLMVLHSDTIDNRQQLFSFLDTYGDIDFSSKYSVKFKFVDEALLPGFFIKQKIDL